MHTKITFRVLAALFIVLFLGTTLRSQNVLVSGAVVGNGVYPDVGTAFTAINSGAQTGAIIIVAIVGNTTEPTTAVLNQGTWAQLTIVPQGGSARTVTGTVVGPLIDFNGADRVLVDGLNSSGNSLTIENTSPGTASTIQFINDAHTIAVQNATILGANTSTASGTVFFSTGTTTGNDTITISTCVISASGANFSCNGIYSAGTPTAGMENSEVVINANNISDYYAPTGSTAGIAVTTGNTGWIIQNNRLFQTATRLHTASATHFGINITSGSAYTISANTIGYANSAGTGTTNIVGNSVTLTGTFPSAYNTTGTPNATRYVAINCAFTAGGPSSEIQGNTVAGFALFTSSGATTTNGIFCGIAVTSGNVNIGTTVGNTIGATTGTGSIYTVCTTTGGIIAGIFVTSANSIAIRNNTIGALDAMGATATTCGGINGINIAGAGTVYDVSGNTIGNTTLPNLRMGNLMTGGNLSNTGTTFTNTSGLSQFNGILSSKTGTGTIGTAALPNMIRNVGHGSTSTTASIRGITASGSPSISSNTITNLSSATTSTGISSTLLAAMGIFLNSISTAGAIVSNNTISTIACTNTTTNGTNVAGVAIYCSSVEIFGNRIYDLRNASTSTAAATPGTASGFFLRQPAGVINIYNNMVSLGAGQTTNTSFNGVWQQNSVVAHTLNLYYNSFNIEGTVASGAQPSFCHNRGSYSAAQVTIPTTTINNIYTNTRTGGTGEHFAIANNYLAAATNVGWGANASNYNVLNASAATVGYWGGSLTFTGWQGASACDQNSQNGVAVNYTNTATGDLHLNFGLTPTTIESGGTVIPTITVDYDAQTRPGPVGSVNGGAFAPDMGADEFDGVPLDATAPAIVYTPLTFTCATTDRIFTATITDNSGVPTTGVLQPRVYFRKNAAAWNSTQGVLIAGNAQNGTWQFTISSAAMGGLVQGDAVSYYVIAQDIVTPTPNIRSNPGVGLVASDVNTVTTPPSPANTYSIAVPLSGVYTVGATGTYTTITAAVNAYNTSCLNGAVEFSLIDATYPGETFPITILSNPDASAINTLTIKPAVGVTTTITGSNTTAIFLLSGADYVTINGTNGSAVSTVCPAVSASRDLTISQTSTSTAAGVVWMATATGPNSVTNCSIENCIITGNSSTTTLVGLGAGGITVGSSGTNNDNLFFINNDIRACQYGIFSGGLNAATKNQGVTVNQNFLDNTAPNNIGLSGIVVNLTNNIVVSGNTVGNIANTASADIAAINVGFSPVGGFLSTTTGIADGASNVTITNNTIGSVQQTGTFSAVGIGLGNTISGTNLIANNMIYGVMANATPGDLAAGIVLGGGTATTDVYHNTISMQGTVAGASAATSTSACLAVTSATVAPLNINNNILVNTQVGNAGATMRFVSIALGYTSTLGNYVSLVSDNNDLFSAGAGPGSYHVGITGGVQTGISRTTIANWQTETGRDIASSNVAATFVSLTDLHAVAGSNPGIEDAATLIPAITTDFDCATRDACTVDMGADEFGTPREIDVQGNAVTITDGDITPAVTDATDFGIQSVCNGTLSSTFTIMNPGTTALTIANVTISGANAADFTVTTSPAASVAASGSTTFTVTFDPSAAGVRQATITVNTNDCDEAAFDYAIQGTGTDVTATAVSQINVACNGGNDGSATVGTNGGIAPFTYAWTPSGGSGVTENNLTAGGYTVTVTDVNGCTATQTFLITEPGVIALLDITTDEVCFGDSAASIDLSVSGGTSPYTYDWNSGTYTTEDISNISSGNYTVVVTDANGCTMTHTVSVAGPSAPLSTVITMAMGPTTCGGSDGMVDITVSGGTVTYSYLWDNSATTEDISGLTAGTYSVTVTDANGCMDTLSVAIADPAGPTVTLAITNDTVCLADGAFTLSGESPSGGTFSGPGVTAGSFDPAAAGVGTHAIMYMFTDVNGCSNSTTDSIYVDICTGTDSPNNTGLVSVYPNPNNGAFTIQFSSANIADVTVYDAQGKLVVAQKMQPNVANTINLDASGIYMLTVITADGQRTVQRVIVNR